MEPELNLGEYETEDEAAYAYNVALGIIYPESPQSEYNHGMTLSREQMEYVQLKVRGILKEQGYRFL